MENDDPPTSVPSAPPMSLRLSLKKLSASSSSSSSPPPPPPAPPLSLQTSRAPAETRKMSKITMFLLREFARALHKLLGQLERLKEFHHAAGLSSDMEASLSALLDHHTMLAQVLSLTLSGSGGVGMRDEGAAGELLLLLEEALPWYYEYAASYLQAQKRLAILLSSDSTLQGLAEDFEIEKLRLAPLLHVSLCLRLFQLATSTTQVSELIKLDNFVSVVALAEESVLFGANALQSGVTLLVSRKRYPLCWFHLTNAVAGVVEPVSLTHKSLQVYLLSKNLTPVGLLCLLGLFILSLIEQPSWCYGNPALCTAPPSANATMFTSGISYLSVSSGLVVELALLLATFVCFCLAETISFRTLKWVPVVKLALLSVAVIECVVSLILAELSIFSWFRISVWIRAALIVLCTRSGRQSSWNVVTALRRCFPILLILLAFLFCSAVIATIIWGGNSSNYFEFFNTMVRLQTTLTTANFPDVMIPEYTENRWSFLYFFWFVVAGNFFLLALVLGELRQAYTESADSRFEIFSKIRRSESVLAFEALAAGRDWIPRSEFFELQTVSARIDPLSRTTVWKTEHQKIRVEVLFGESDRCDLQLWSRKVLQAINTSVHNSYPKWRSLLDARLASGILIAICAVCVAVMGVTSWAVLAKDQVVILSMFWIVQALLLLTVAEAVIKVVLFRTEYWSYFKGDALLLALGISADVTAISLQRYEICVIWCCFVLFRLSYLWTFSRSIFSAMSDLHILFVAILPPLVSYYLGFAWIGVYVFGGKLYKGQPLLNGTLYEANNYYALNWNDVASGLVSQFVLLVGNNAYLLSAACANVAGVGTRGFFYAFWVVNVLVLLNLFFALVFRVVDLAKASDSREPAKLDVTEVRENVENEELSPMISLQNGQYWIEMEDFNEYDYVNRRVVARGNSVIFSKSIEEK